MALGVGNVQQVKILSPQEHLANALELRAAQLQIDQQESETAAKLRTEATKAKRQAWLKATTQAYRNDDGSPDWPRVLTAADQDDPEFSMDLRDWYTKSRAAEIELNDKELGAKANRFGMVARLADTVQDGDADGYQLFRQMAVAADPALKDLPEQYDPASTPAYLKQLSQRGMMSAAYAQTQREAMKEAAANAINADQYFAKVLPDATEQQDVDDAFESARILLNLNADQMRAYRQKFGTAYGEGYGERAKRLSMTPVEQNAEANTAADNAARDAAAERQASQDAINNAFRGREVAATEGNLRARQAEGAAANAPISTNLPKQAQAVVARIITGQPGTRVGPIKQEVARLAAAGDEERLKSYLRFAATRTVGEARQEVMRGRVETLTALKDAEAILKQVPTGFLKGNWEDVMRTLGRTSDPRLVDLGTRMGAILANYQRSISGAAVTDAESARLGRLIPNYSNNLPVNLGQLRGFSEAIKSFDKGFYENTFGQDYDWVMGTSGGGGGRAGGGGSQADPMGIR